jgi:hypothetical protein
MKRSRRERRVGLAVATAIVVTAMVFGRATACMDCDFTLGAQCHSSRESTWAECKTVGANMCWFRGDCGLSPKGPIIAKELMFSLDAGHLDGFPILVSAGSVTELRDAVAVLAGTTSGHVAVRGRMFHASQGDIPAPVGTALSGLGGNSVLYSITRDAGQASARLRVCSFTNGMPLTVNADQTIGNGQALLVAFGSSPTQYVIAYELVLTSADDLEANLIQWQNDFAQDVDSHLSGGGLSLSLTYAPSNCNP